MSLYLPAITASGAIVNGALEPPPRESPLVEGRSRGGAGRAIPLSLTPDRSHMISSEIANNAPFGPL